MTLEKAIQSRGFNTQKQKALVNIMYTAYEVKTRLSQALKEYGITTEQYNVLRILKGQYPNQICVKEIAERMIERSSNVPRILDRLEAKNLVQRTQSGIDKRETVILLSQAGIDMLETVHPVLLAVQDEITDLDESEMEQLNLILDRFLKD